MKMKYMLIFLAGFAVYFLFSICKAVFFKQL